MPNRGGVNRRTGKTTPRSKPRTHWGAKRSAGGTPASSKKNGKAKASGVAKK